MIVSRAAELGRLDELLERLHAGDGQALVIHGEPGIGKTTLLEALVERCAGDVTVLRARGVETEAELAFAALSDLLAPAIDDLATLPAPQSAALAGALALGPPAPGDRLAVCVATLGLLRTAARRRPVLVVMDDIQWLDAASRECILYVAHRAGGALAVALAVRDPWDPALERAELPALEVGPFDAEASAELLARIAPDAAPAVAAALVEAAAGNPLALVELPANLTAAQLTGVAGLELPLAPGSRLQGAFAARVEELDEPTRRALLIAAIHAGDDLTAITAACDAAATEVGLLVRAEERGLVRLASGHVSFSHPLIRGAVHRAADPAERRRAHRALAGAVGGERRVWHLAAATVGADEQVAGELERVADAATGRRAFAAASAAHERAARLSPERGARARRLLAAGRAAGAAGAPERALALLEEASGDAGDGALRARAEQLRGRVMIWTGAPVEATQLLVAEGEHAAERHPALAAELLADASNGCTAINDYHRAETLARRAVELLGDERDPAARAPVQAIFGWALLLRGDAPGARLALEEAERLAAQLDPLGPHWPWHHLLLRARVPLGDFERALEDGLAIADRARDAGALATLGGALVVAADAAFRLGRWDVADDATSEAIRVAVETGQHSWHGYALSTRTRLLAARGCEAEGRRAGATALAIAESMRISSGLRFVHGAVGFLELSAGNVAGAIAELEAIERLVAGSGLGEPTLVPWAPDLVEAHVRSGRLEDARRVLAELELQAATSGTVFAGAAAARCRGMLEDDFEPAFAHALALHERCPLPFERARTLLALGRRLHRTRRRAEARERLREALGGFEQLGAAAWAAQARDELRAAGARRRRARDDALTPQELRVAAAVARGASNREVAAELFLAPKTIEFHLRQIYRKLGIRSRTQLVAALSGETRPEGGVPTRSGVRP